MPKKYIKNTQLQKDSSSQTQQNSSRMTSNMLNNTIYDSLYSKITNIQPLTTLKEVGCDNDELLSTFTATINDCRDKATKHIMDRWSNEVASIGENNSIQQYSKYLFERLSWQECAQLATDPMIAKAVNTIKNEIFSHGGQFIKIDGDFSDYVAKYKLLETIKTAVVKALEFGGCLIYIKTNDSDSSKALYLNEQMSTANKLLGFSVLEPWQFAPSIVNTTNPTDSDYLKPTAWWIMGEGMVHASRVIKLEFFEISYMLRPLLNYMGIPLSFYMKNYVASADTVRQNLADLFLRFNTLIIKTNKAQIASQEGIDRVKLITKQRNNLGMLMLTNEEELQSIETNLSGLGAVLSQMYELLVATSGIPATKLLGMSPSGFNATGEFDMMNYYDTIAGYQTNIVAPVLEQLGRVTMCLGVGKYINDIKYEFKPLGRMTEQQTVELDEKIIELVWKFHDAGLINDTQAIDAIRNKDYKLLNINISDNKLQKDIAEELSDDPEIDDLLNGVVTERPTVKNKAANEAANETK